MTGDPPEYGPTPPDDLLGRAVWRADRLLAPVEFICTLIGGIMVFGLMILGMIQIILRNLFSAPIFGYIDMVEFGMIGFAIFGIAWLQRMGGHVRMELILGRLRGRAMWLAETVGVLLGMIIVAILIPYSYQHFGRAWELGDSTIDIELVTWPGKLAVPIFLGFLFLRFGVQLFAYLRLLLNPALAPVGAPHIKTVEELAKDEIEGTA